MRNLPARLDRRPAAREVLEGEIVSGSVECRSCGGTHYAVGKTYPCCCGEEHDIIDGMPYCCACGHYHGGGGVCPATPCGSYLCCRP